MIPGIDEVASKLQEFYKEVTFPSITAPKEIQELLNVSREDIRNKDKEELSIDAVVLSQYAMYITIQMNKLRAKLSWCDFQIDSIIGRELSNTSGYGFQEKSLIIKRNDEVARSVEQVRSLLLIKLATLKDLDEKIKDISKAILSLQYVKE